jgi:hypothetical protein
LEFRLQLQQDLEVPWAAWAFDGTSEGLALSVAFFGWQQAMAGASDFAVVAAGCPQPVMALACPAVTPDTFGIWLDWARGDSSGSEAETATAATKAMVNAAATMV